MGFSELVSIIIAVSSGLLGLFAWSHSSLSKRLDKLSIDLQERRTDADIRILIQDKIEPYKVELQNLSKQLDLISHQYRELDKKLDSVLDATRKTHVN